MNSSHDVRVRYQAAMKAYGDICSAAPEKWHRPDVAEFTELRQLLLPHAESGDLSCQYALATILGFGLCCETEEQFAAEQDEAKKEATRWWIAAAKQGFCPALDNLVTCGTGPEAQRAKDAWHQLEQERPDLVTWYRNMPVYGPEFIEELSRRLYGQVIKDSY